MLNKIDVQPVNSTYRTLRSQSNHSQEPCEWFDHDLQVLFINLEQILYLKVDCLDFGTGALYPTGSFIYNVIYML